MTSLIALLSQMMYDIQTQQNLRSLHVVHILYQEVSYKVIALEKRHIIHYSHSKIFLCLGIFLNISWAYIYLISFDMFHIYIMLLSFQYRVESRTTICHDICASNLNGYMGTKNHEYNCILGDLTSNEVEVHSMQPKVS